MKLNTKRFRLGAFAFASFVSVALVSAALAQPPRPGGGGGGAPGGGGPGGGPGGGGPGGSGPGPGSGPGVTPSPTFVLNFCNKANDAPVIFVAVTSVANQQFRAQGWIQVPAGQCVSAGSFQRPTVWGYGRTSSGTLWGDQKTGVDLCVNLNGGFDYTWDGSGRQCRPDESAVPFFKIDVPPTANNFNMTLN